MGDAISKLLLAWLGGAKRALATVALGSFLALLLWRYPPFADAMKDPLLRLPLVAFVLSLCGLVTYVGEYLAKAAWKRYKIPRRLLNLTEDEQAVLQKYLQEQVTVYNWERFGMAAEVLRRNGILHLLASDASGGFPEIPTDSLTIDPIAWKYLNTHPDLVGLAPTNSLKSRAEWLARLLKNISKGE